MQDGDSHLSIFRIEVGIDIAFATSSCSYQRSFKDRQSSPNYLHKIASWSVTDF